MATPELDASAVRAAENQNLFRDVNERIEAITQGIAEESRVI
jgi:hypothetical protein